MTLDKPVCSPRNRKKKNITYCKAKKEDLPYFIGTIEEAEQFYRVNPYILTGYRVNFNSFRRLFRSLFMLHNETINIWTHLIGGLIFIFLIIHTFEIYEPSDFYYQIMAHHKDKASNLLDMGIPYDRLHKL